MRKFTFIVLVALCFAFQGRVNASSADLPICQEEFLENSEISPQLAETILKYVALEYGYDLQCLCEDYAKGDVEIDKNANGYLVTMKDGGVGLMVIIEGI